MVSSSVPPRRTAPTLTAHCLGAFIAGVLLVAQLPSLAPLPLAAGLVPLAAAAWRLRSLPVAGFLVAVLIAAGHGLLLLSQRLEVSCDGRWTRLSGVVVDLPQRQRLGDDRWQQRFRLRVEHIARPECRGPRLLSLAYYGDRRLRPGERWALSARLRLPWGEDNPGGRNRQDYFAREGIDATGSVRSADAVRLAGPEGRALHQQLRARLRQALARSGVAEGPRALLAALLVGDQSALSDAQWDLLRRLGVVHLVVVSGLHVSLVGAFGWFGGALLARLLAVAGARGAWPGVPALSALAAASAYAALAGFSLPTQRALIMLGCLMGALLAGRRARSPRNLLLAAGVVLAANPLAATGSGFWLSFAAVAWLLWYAARPGRRRGWRGALALHAFMTLAMAPLSGWWFGGVSLVAVLANLLLVPFVAVFLVPLVLAGGACWFWWPGLAGFCWQLAAWPLTPLLAGAEGFVADVGGWLYLPVAAGPLESALAVVGVLLLFGARRRRWRLSGLPALLPLLLPGAPGVAERPTLTVLDVGQGTAVVFRSGGRTLVYDTGGGDPAGNNAAARVVLPFLRARRVRRIDRLVVSHPDRDHSAGVATLRAALPITAIAGGRALAAAPGLRSCRTGASWRWPDGTRFRFLTASAPRALGSNDVSCVLLIDAQGYRFLLPGDIGVRRERELVRYWRDTLRADWLLVAHHGSASSTSAAWLRAVRPARAVLTHGRANPFGHPAPAVLARLCRAGVDVDATASGGALSYRVAAGGVLTVRASRAAAPRYWRRAPPLTPLACAAYNRRTAAG